MNPVLVLVGVAGTSRVDLLGVPPHMTDQVFAAVSGLGVSSETVDDVMRCDSDPWDLDRVVATVAQTVPARAWRWVDDRCGGWGRDHVTPGQAVDDVVEVVHVTARNGWTEMDVLGDSDVLTYLSILLGECPWPLRMPELPTAVGAFTVHRVDDPQAAMDAIRGILGGVLVREWVYSEVPS